MDDGLRVRLTSDEREQLVRHPTTDGDAYDLYLQARYSQRLATEEDYLFSREPARECGRARPEVRVGLRVARGQLRHDGWSMDSSVRPTRGHRSAGTCGRPWRSIRRCPRRSSWSTPWRSCSIGTGRAPRRCAGGSWRRRSAISIRSSRERSPSSCGRSGRRSEALQLARRTRELDTRSPYLAVLEADYLLRDDQFDAAIALYEYAIKLDPQNANALFGLAEARMRQGRFDEAIEARRQAHEVAGDDRLDTALRHRQRRGGIPPDRRGMGPSSARGAQRAGEDQVRVTVGLRASTMRRLARRSWRSSTSTPPSSTGPLVSCS